MKVYSTDLVHGSGTGCLREDFILISFIVYFQSITVKHRNAGHIHFTCAACSKKPHEMAAFKSDFPLTKKNHISVHDASDEIFFYHPLSQLRKEMFI